MWVGERGYRRFGRHHTTSGVFAPTGFGRSTECLGMLERSKVRGGAVGSMIEKRRTEEISMVRSSWEVYFGGVVDDESDSTEDEEEATTDLGAKGSVGELLRAPPTSAKEYAPKETSPEKDFSLESLECDNDMSVKDSSESCFLTTFFSMKTGRLPLALDDHFEPRVVEPREVLVTRLTTELKAAR